MSMPPNHPFLRRTPQDRRRRVVAEKPDRTSPSPISVVLAVLIVAGVTSGCAVSRAPYDWLPTVDSLAADPYGAWIEVKQRDTTRYGELIAIDADSLFLLPAAPRAQDDLDPDVAGYVQVIPRSTVSRARLFWFDSDWERLALMAVGGTAGSLSHGVMAVISWPFWIIGGISTSYFRSRDPLIEYPDAPWTLFSSYARFPQGLSESNPSLKPRR